MKVAVIPARGGSKRIPRKNLREFCGLPMLAWPLRELKASQLFDRIIVSTDDDDIASLAQTYGAEVPFRRPAELADDHTPTQPVIAHAIEALQADGCTIDWVCCVYATAPFLRAEDVQTGFQAVSQTGITYSFAATAYRFPIQRAFYLDEAGRPQMFQPEHALTRSQDLIEAYHDAGQFYWGSAQTWQAGGAIFGPDARPVMLPAERVQDIDTESDWRRAEALMQVLLAE